MRAVSTGDGLLVPAQTGAVVYLSEMSGVTCIIPLLPPPEWTVEADGWHLVIEDGAIRGIRRIG